MGELSFKEECMREQRKIKRKRMMEDIPFYIIFACLGVMLMCQVMKLLARTGVIV